MVEGRDVVVVGGGPAGLTAALYAARGGVSTLIFEKAAAGGQVASTGLVENYPGFPDGVDGPELAESMKRQAIRFGVEWIDAEVSRVEQEGGGFALTAGDERYGARAVILAAGASPRKLGVPGEAALTGRGVSYCATCDGPLFKGKDVAVVGGGDAAVEEALALARFASSVTLIHRRGELRAKHVLRLRLEAEPKARLLLGKVVARIEGAGRVAGLALKDVATAAESSLAVGGVFIFVGHDPDTAFLRGFVEMDGAGYIETGAGMMASVPGVFACGDCRAGSIRQAVSAAGEGCAAALAAVEYLALSASQAGGSAGRGGA